MGNTYSQLYLHYVFAVKGRNNLLNPKYNTELQKYIRVIIENRNSKLLKINNMPDHMHILVSTKPACPIPKLIQDIKSNSSKLINEKRWIQNRFNWQRGYGVFSHSHSNISRVCRYIENQQEHHQNQSFKDEYIGLLEEHDIDYDDRYLFEFY